MNCRASAIHFQILRNLILTVLGWSRMVTTGWLQGNRSASQEVLILPVVTESSEPHHRTVSTLMIFLSGRYHQQKLMTIETPHCVFVRRRRVIGLRSCHANGRYRVERWWGEVGIRGRGSLQVGGCSRSRHVSPWRGLTINVPDGWDS